MSRQPTIEKRLAALEKALAEVRERLALEDRTPNWIRRMAGSMQDNPLFEEFVAECQAIRQADRPADDSVEQP